MYTKVVKKKHWKKKYGIHNVSDVRIIINNSWDKGENKIMIKWKRLMNNFNSYLEHITKTRKTKQKMYCCKKTQWWIVQKKWMNI